MVFEHSDLESNYVNFMLDRAKEMLEKEGISVTSLKIMQYQRKFAFTCEIKASGNLEKIHVKSPYYKIDSSRELVIGDALKGQFQKTIFLNKILSEDTPTFVAEMIAFDLENKILITKFIEGKGIHEFLLGSEKIKTISALTNYISAMANYHGTTGGKLLDYYNKYTQFDKTNIEGWTFSPPENYKVKFEKILKLMEINYTSDFFQEYSLVINELTQSKYKSIIHGDPCPDNVLITKEGAKFIDFDAGGYSSIFVDLVYIEFWPSCWCSGLIPGKIKLELKHKYLEIINNYDYFSDLTFSTLNRGLFLAKIAWLFTNLLWTDPQTKGKFIKNLNNRWGIDNRHNRLKTRLNELCLELQDEQEFVNIRSVFSKILNFLEKEFGDTKLSIFPSLT